jgi:hypothetical protein
MSYPSGGAIRPIRRIGIIRIPLGMAAIHGLVRGRRESGPCALLMADS